MSSFKHTPIPHRTRYGEPMAYYTLSDDEKHISVSRAECLARTDEPDNPYPQRWFVDEESGLVVRLPRNAKGEKLARDNMQFIWREAKKWERKMQCIWKDTKKCDQQCDTCNCKSSRTIELDMHFGQDNSGDESEGHFEPVADCDIASIVEDETLLNTLRTAIKTLLTEDEAAVIDGLFALEQTERGLAATLGFKSSGSVHRRKNSAIEKLRDDDDLKSFFN